MPVGQITNPLAEEGENASNGSLEETYVNGDSVALAVGQLVEFIVPFTGAGTTLQVKRSSTTPDFLLAGVVTGGSAPGQPAAVGGPVTVLVKGKAQIICDDTGGGVTAGDNLQQSTTTAGQAKTTTTTATVGKTIGVALQTVTIASGSALVYAAIHLL